MINFQLPFCCRPPEVSQSYALIGAALGATQFAADQAAFKCGRLYLIGPEHLLWACASNPQIEWHETILSYLNKSKTKDAGRKVLGKGLYIPLDYAEPNLPIALYYRLVKELGDKPVLVQEYRMNPGDLLVVPDSSTVVCCVSYQDSRTDAITSMPEEFQWICWTGTESVKDPMAIGSDKAEKVQENKWFETPPRNLTFSPCFINAPKNELVRCLDDSTQCVQLYPLAHSGEMQQLREALLASPAWIRRTGDIYTQVAIDLNELIKTPNCPAIVHKFVSTFKSQDFVDRVSAITGLALTELREIATYRMVGGEYISNHADGTFGGYLKVRLNWLLQNPVARKTDLRFWDPEKPALGRITFDAKENALTVFFVGEETPHDITPLPDTVEKDRLNIVMSFG
jgi:hypothetical protein